MIIWRGWGIVVVGIALGAFVLGTIVGNFLHLSDNGSVQVSAVLLIAGGVLTWYLGKRMNQNMDRQLIDPQSGQPVIVRNDHSLFFIRVEWWGPIMVVAGVLFFWSVTFYG